jgi:hypothetical protein
MAFIRWLASLWIGWPNSTATCLLNDVTVATGKNAKKIFNPKNNLSEH